MTEADYNAKYKANLRIDGTGFDTTIHSPCPFCAEPGFMSYTVALTEAALATDTTCKKCGRGAKTIITKSGGGTTARMVQTRGDDAPPYIPITREGAN
jgi:hypothetical protein